MTALTLDQRAVLHSPALAAHSWLEHGFGTRDSGDWPPPGETATLRQIHSAVVVAAGKPGMLGEGDALVTREPGLFVAVRTADCVPILIADRRQRAVAAVHAGWRGTEAAIVRLTVNTLVCRYHSDPKDLVAVIGPAIGKCCYEVSQEVAARFHRWLPELASSARQEKVMLDLWAVNRAQLLEAGVEEGSIATTEGLPCTRCREDLLHSFRRDGERSGRMHSAIRIRPDCKPAEV